MFQIMKPTIFEANSLVNKMLEVNPLQYGFNDKFWYTLPFNQRKFYLDHVLVTFEGSIDAIYNGCFSPPVIYETIRSARMSKVVVETILNKSSFSINNMIRRQRKVGRSSETYQKVQTWGESKELEALSLYQSQKNFEFDVRTCGHVLSPNFPMLISQVDGIAFKNQEPSHLIEVKSLDMDDLEQTYGFYEDCFRKRAFGYTINKQSHIYRHLQMSMMLLNLPTSELVIYKSKERRISQIIRTDRDDTYLATMMCNILPKYINIIIPEFTRSVESYIVLDSTESE